MTVLGHDVRADYAQARRKLGVVPQELVFDPFFNVREALRIQSGYFGIKNNDAWIDELLDSLGLTDKANANMRQLSGGMKRRVLVAQALVHKPPVIVLDEPTAGVDVELRQTLWQFICQTQQAGPYRAADHALSGRGRSPVRPHRHAQSGPGGGAGHAPATCSRRRRATCCASRSTAELPQTLAAQAARHRAHGAVPRARRAGDRAVPGGGARSRLDRAKTWKSARPIWKTCFCGDGSEWRRGKQPGAVASLQAKGALAT